MLLNFSVENYKSISDRVNLDLTPSNSIRKFKEHIVHDDSGAKALRGAIICGSNAAGKSNVIKAMSYAKKVALNKRTKKLGTGIPQFRYHEDSENNFSRFEFEFSNNGKIYAYGFILDRKEIHEEWLYLINKDGVERKLFTRKLDLDEMLIAFGEYLLLDEDEEQLLFLANKTVTKNTLYLHHVSQLNIVDKLNNHMKNVVDWLDNKLIVVYPESRYMSFEKDIVDDEKARKFYISVLKAFDTGITDIQVMQISLDELPVSKSEKIRSFIEDIEDIEDETNILVSIDGSRYLISVDAEGELEKLHEVIIMSGDKKFKINELSDGTIRLMDIIPAIYSAIKEDIIFLIDEIDRSLHSLITKALMAVFYNSDIETKGQLVVTTHETSLIDQNIMRRDAIWLVQKEHNFSTVLYPLTEYELRHDKKISSDYLNGLFGGVISYDEAIDKIKGAL